MASQRDTFNLSGPLWLTTIDWKNVHHRRSVAASLVHSVYVLERDRQNDRKGPESLAPSWWNFFHFKLHSKLIDDEDSSIFGAIYEFKPPFFNRQHSTKEGPRYVIAFRGTIMNPHSWRQEDLRLDLLLIIKGLHGTSRFKVAMQAVQNMVDVAGASNIWLVGHSLGSAVAMLAGKNMAKASIFLQETFLFNPPFLSAPIESSFKSRKLKQGVRIVKSFATAGLTVAVKGRRRSEDPFVGLSGWVPCLFVNPAVWICSEYIGYFEHREKMEKIGARRIGKLANRNSIGSLLFGKNESEPLHLLPSAYLIKNKSPSQDVKRDHGLRQWWKPESEQNLDCKVYQYR